MPRLYKISYKTILFFFILAIAKISVAQTATKSTSAKPTNNTPQIDGEISEVEWESCMPASGFIQFSPNPGQVPSQKTEVRMMYGNKAIYVAAKLFDTQPDSISTLLTSRDDRGMADGFQVLIDTYADASVAYGFGVTAAGVQVDSKSLGTGGEDMNWNAVWKSATSVNEKGWVAEFEIPYSALRFPTKSKQLWHINFVREIKRHREISTWQAADPSADNMLLFMGELNGIQNIKSPLRLSISPFVATYAEKKTDQKQPSYSLKGGLDLKYGISESFTLDMMLIPDFGQVKSDDKYLNLTPYETYYEENRAFFTEGTELFDRAGIFYSRRIGGTPREIGKVDAALTDEEMIEKNPTDLQLLNATKISGKTKSGFSLGFLNGISRPAVSTLRNTNTNATRDITTQPFTNYNVTVAEKTFKNNSYISLINTNLHIPNSKFTANVTGIDGKISNKNNSYAIIGKAAISSIFENQKEANFGHYYYLKLAKTSGNIHFSVTNYTVSDTYNPNDMGYVRRNNEFKNSLSISYDQYEARGKILSWNIDASVHHEMMYKPLAYSSSTFASFLRFTFLNHLTTGGRFSANLSEKYDYREPREEGRFVQLPRMLYNISAFISSNYAKKIALDIFAGTWKTTQKGSQSYFLNISPRWQMTKKLFTVYATDFDFTNAQLGYIAHSPKSDSIFFGLRHRVSITNTLDLQYIFTNKTTLTLRGRHYRQTVEYTSISALKADGLLEDLPNKALSGNINSNAFSADAIFAWEFAPGSQLSLAWKNLIFADNDFIQTPYFENFNATFKYPQTNSISIKVLYYLDYLYLKKS